MPPVMLRAVSLLLLSAAAAFAVVDYPAETAPGEACASLTESGATLSNALFTASFEKAEQGLLFGGLKRTDGTEIASAGTPVFTVLYGKGKQMRSDRMVLSNLKVGKLKPAKRSKPLNKLAFSYPGQVVTATFTSPDNFFHVDWRAELREGSAYLRQEFRITAHQNTNINGITALQYDMVPHGALSVSGNTTHGNVVINDLAFAGLESPLFVMTIGNHATAAEEAHTPDAWDSADFESVFARPASFAKVYGERFTAMNGPVVRHLRMDEHKVQFDAAGECTFTFSLTDGVTPFCPVAVQLLREDGSAVVAEDVHEGMAAPQGKAEHAAYTLSVPAAGTYTLRYWAHTRKSSGQILGSGKVAVSLPHRKPQATPAELLPDNRVSGSIRRGTTLAKGKTWEASSVLGLFAPQQQRRSFLAYLERERALPYHPFVHYNDWYEIGIRIHDLKDPSQRTNEAMWLALLDTWQRELGKRKVNLDCFVLDDGWDDFNSLWDFHIGFPNGFSKLDKKARAIKAGLGTWLGPVGGYGTSKQMRLDNWNKTHPASAPLTSFKLSNEEYFKAFTGRCKAMMKAYDMRYFKFDGISTKFHAKGPADIEDAEGILSVLRDLRKVRRDLFINTSVGTWASPFWFCYSDSAWRQENDFGQIGLGDARDKWMTYRDRLVHEVFVEGAPLFPINSVMTHGIIITKNGPPRVMSTDPQNCLKEIRASFGSGSALQEMYTDTDLLAQNNGALWDALAEGIRFIRRNADIMADIHWVGGNPWDGQDGDVYGWAAWSPKGSTLTLRNSSDKPKTLHTTLRRILDIPPHIKGTLTLKNTYADQRPLPGLTDTPADLDRALDITLQPFEVLVLEGK